jgi:hypothetical protein
VGGGRWTCNVVEAMLESWTTREAVAVVKRRRCHNIVFMLGDWQVRAPRQCLSTAKGGDGWERWCQVGKEEGVRLMRGAALDWSHWLCPRESPKMKSQKLK